MTDDPTTNSGPEAPLPLSGRSSSVRLRDAAPRSARGALRLDAANQSLADALRLTYRLVQAAMVVLVVLFLASGFRAIQEGEIGIATTFGRPTQTSLEPGFNLSWPYPVGELITVGTGTGELRIDRAFFPFVQPGREDTPERELSTANGLNPERDGSLITADQNIAHAQWTVNYRRSDHLTYARNVAPDLERELVERVVRRAVVRTVAETPIDDLLKDRTDVSARAAQYAQEYLRETDSGIVIEQLVLNRKFAPPNLLEQFTKVQAAVQSAGQARVVAQSQAEGTLSAVAGDAAPHLVRLINVYERALELGDQAEASATLATIDAMLEGRPVEIDGRVVEARPAGEVAQILADARSRRVTTVANARRALDRFLGVQTAMAANPSLTLTEEWADAIEAFLEKPFVETFLVREGSGDTVEVRLNRDPDVAREAERAFYRRQAEASAAEAEQARRRARFQTDRGIQTDEE